MPLMYGCLGSGDALARWCLCAIALCDHEVHRASRTVSGVSRSTLWVFVPLLLFCGPPVAPCGPLRSPVVQDDHAIL
jgi:hypothetical protein